MGTLPPLASHATPGTAIPPEAEPPAPMSRVIGGGMAWFVALNLGSKVVAFAAQMALAWLLSQKDFGIYATAIAVSSFVSVFRDGGVGAIMIQRGEGEYPRLIGPVFWIAMAVNGATALVLAAFAPIVASIHGERALLGLLLVIAFSLAIGTPGSILLCKLRMQLRFRLFSQIATASALIRYGSTVAFAWLGFGPLSFVLPLPIIAVFECAAGYIATRDRPWRISPGLRHWPELLTQGKWLVLGTLAGIMIDMGDYLIIGFFVPKAVLGVYFFANQLALQSVYTLLSHNAALVLAPALARLSGDRMRQHAGAVRSLRALMLLAVPGCLGLAVVMEPVEALLLGGRWREAVLPLQIIAFLLPFRCTTGLTTGVLHAQGRFKRHAALCIVEGSVMMAAAAAGAILSGQPAVMALCTASAMAIGRLVITAIVMRRCDVSLPEVLASIFPPWILGAGSACLVFWLDGALTQSLPSAARLVMMGGAFGAAFVLSARLVLSRQIHEALPAAPTRLVPFIERLLLMRHREAAL